MNAILVFLLRLIFVLLSYLFIGWIGYIIYKDIQGMNLSNKGTTIPPITLQTTVDQEQISKRFSIPEIIIGRDPACDFPLNDETISLRHSKLSYHHKQWWVEDLGSTNGTFLNDNLIEEPIILSNDDRVRLGRKTFTIITNSTSNGENNG